LELSTTLDPERRIFTLRVTGVYRRPDDGLTAQRYVIDSFAEHGFRRILLDVRAAEIRSGTLQTYDTAKSHPDLMDELRKFKFAALYAEISPDERFFEDAAVNRGLSVRVFDDHDEAIRWLMER